MCGGSLAPCTASRCVRSTVGALWFSLRAGQVCHHMWHTLRDTVCHDTVGRVCHGDRPPGRTPVLIDTHGDYQLSRSVDVASPRDGKNAWLRSFGGDSLWLAIHIICAVQSSPSRRHQPSPRRRATPDISVLTPYPCAAVENSRLHFGALQDWSRIDVVLTLSPSCRTLVRGLGREFLRREAGLHSPLRVSCTQPLAAAVPRLR